MPTNQSIPSIQEHDSRHFLLVGFTRRAPSQTTPRPHAPVLKPRAAEARVCFPATHCTRRRHAREVAIGYHRPQASHGGNPHKMQFALQNHAVTRTTTHVTGAQVVSPHPPELRWSHDWFRLVHLAFCYHFELLFSRSCLWITTVTVSYEFRAATNISLPVTWRERRLNPSLPGRLSAWFEQQRGRGTGASQKETWGRGARPFITRPSFSARAAVPKQKRRAWGEPVGRSVERWRNGFLFLVVFDR